MNWRNKALLRPRELADISSQSVRTIRRKIRSGAIASSLQGGARVITIAECLRYVGEDPSIDLGGSNAVDPDVLDALDKIQNRIRGGKR